MGSNRSIDVAIGARCGILLGAFELLPNAGGRVADLFNNILQLFSSDSEMPRPVFDFDLILHGDFAAVGPCGF